MIAILRNSDSVLSSIHRSMQNTYKALCIYLKIDTKEVVSRTIAPYFKKVNIEKFSKQVFAFLKIDLTEN